MPPFVGRKRRSTSPLPEPQPPTKKARTTQPGKATKGTARVAAPAPAPSLKQPSSLSSDSDSSLSDVDSDEFEDIPGSKPKAHTDDDEDEFEDVPAHKQAPDFSNREFKDIKITVDKDDEPDYGISARAGQRKGPTRREKEVRMRTHKMHVQFLLWHNAKRNAWINDEKVHNTLLKQLPAQINREIEKWRRASGLLLAPKEPEKELTPKERRKMRKKAKQESERNQRDWGKPSQRLEEGKPDMSQGDPILSLLKVLAAYWKKRFAITAPGLRKRGYGTKLGLRKDIESYKNEKHHPAKHGEKIETLEEFRKIAEKCEGSRDIGAQLFTALLRAVGIEARMVVSLQPAGYGFTKAEQLVPRKIIDPGSSSESEDADDSQLPKVSKSANKSKKKTPAKKATSRPHRARGAKSQPIDLDSDAEDSSSSDDDSVADVTPTMPKAKPAKYDRDLLFPHCWCEAVSPITFKVIPISPLLLESPVATSPEMLSTFEPRGAKADKVRQVMAYVVAWSADFSAKDVTVRYLRKRLWPGKTKGFRIPAEKIPIYDTQGKVRRYEDYDWFQDVLSIYQRPHEKRTRADELEDNNDLIPAEPEKKQTEGDTLQSLKSSDEFVLERHLRREEALKPGAEPVRTFTFGKGEKQVTDPVYLRADVLKCMTAESWHKDGRRPREGEVLIKLAPVRAVTLTRKREAEEYLIRTGEKQMQGLYSIDQTDWIIPPPIKDGKIPKNSYGNIDCFVPSMVPKGAVHLPLKGTVRICKKLEIDYAEAVVGFDFGNKMAVPVVHGVVIAKENENTVRDAWRTWNEEQKKKEETKMEKLVLDLWSKFYRGLLIRSRVQEEYGLEIAPPADLNQGMTRDKPIEVDGMDDGHDINHGMSGGFLLSQNSNEFGGGFLVEHEDEAVRGEDLVMDHGTQEEPEELAGGCEVAGADEGMVEYPTPISGDVRPTSTRRSAGAPKRTVIEDSDGSSFSEPDSLVQEVADDDTAGGFLASDIDDEETDDKINNHKKPIATKHKDHIETSDDFTPSPATTSQRRGRPRKVATTSTPTLTKSTKTRATPARTAKSQAKMNSDGAASGSNSDSDSGSADTDLDSEDGISAPKIARKNKPPVTESKHAREAKVKSETAVAKRGRGPPRKNDATVDTAKQKPKQKAPAVNGKRSSGNGNGRRLLRKESTLVTSPYFNGSGDGKSDANAEIMSD